MEKAGREERFYLPSQRFNRKIGVYANESFDPHGEMMDDKTYWSKHVDWLPTHDDLAYVQSVMVQVTEPGKFAGWIAPPAKGLNGQEVEFEYVKLGG
jgi:benzoyl-CoA 2,3-dioxygenase component B